MPRLDRGDWVELLLALINTQPYTLSDFGCELIRVNPDLCPQVDLAGGGKAGCGLNINTPPFGIHVRMNVAPIPYSTWFFRQGKDGTDRSQDCRGPW